MSIKAAGRRFFQTSPPSIQDGTGWASSLADTWDALPSPADFAASPERSLPNSNFYDIHQPQPATGSRDDKPSFTYSLNSYLKAADTLARCLILNSKSKAHGWLATISIQENLEAHEHKKLWSKISRRVKSRGIEAFWVRETNQEGRIHYHLIVTGEHQEQELADQLRSSVEGVGARVHVAEITNLVAWCRYIVKARVKGVDDWGDYSSDKWSSKRILFARHCGLSKHGSIGKFWATPFAELKRRVVKEKQAYRANEEKRRMEETNIIATATIQERDRAYHLHQLTGVATKTILLTEVRMRDGYDGVGLPQVPTAKVGDGKTKDRHKGVAAVLDAGEDSGDDVQGEVVRRIRPPTIPTRSPLLDFGGVQAWGATLDYRRSEQLGVAAQASEPGQGGGVFDNSG